MQKKFEFQSQLDFKDSFSKSPKETPLEIETIK